jgi:hypothetical protein
MRATTPTRCGRCGASYDLDALDALAHLHTVGEAEIASIATRWPAGVVVDVRACARCASPIARLRAPARQETARAGVERPDEGA